LPTFLISKRRAHVTVTSRYLVTGGATVSRDKRWVLEALEAGGFHHGDVYLADRSDELTMLSVQGPYSHRLLQPLVSCGALDDLDAFDFSTARTITFAGVEGVTCARAGLFTRADSFGLRFTYVVHGGGEG
jgi:glycine cleavage system aminomethyltransferase T